MRQDAGGKAATQIMEVVSSGNTTIIGDYIPTCYSMHDRKWLVQAKGNETLDSVYQAIVQKSITVDRHYIFLMVGHNQVHALFKTQVMHKYQAVVTLIRNINGHAKIFVATLLPRPVDNMQAKLQIIKFNRALAQMVTKMKKKDPRVILLPVQHKFVIDSQPDISLYNSDLFTLNEKQLAQW